MRMTKPSFWNEIKVIYLPIFLILLPLSLIFKIIVANRKFFYKKKKFKKTVICVGNIYIGGTGKTPLSLELNKSIKKMGFNPVIIKKNYDDQIDEIRLIKDKTKNIIVKKSRIAAIKLAFKKKYDVAILDDGIQDHTIYKKIKIVCFGAQGIGNGMVMPAGPLRESLSSLKNCQFAIINNINGKINKKLLSVILKFNKKINIFFSNYEPNSNDIKKYKNKKIYAFAGIGNPENFFKMLSNNNLIVKKIKSFPDHHKYSFNEIRGILEYAKKNKLKILTTEKDFFRIKHMGFRDIKYISVRLKIKNRNHFLKKLRSMI